MSNGKTQDGFSEDMTFLRTEGGTAFSQEKNVPSEACRGTLFHKDWAIESC